MRQKRDWLYFLSYKQIEKKDSELRMPYTPDFKPPPSSFSSEEIEEFKKIPQEEIDEIIRDTIAAYPHIKEEHMQEAFNKIKSGDKTPYKALQHILHTSPEEYAIYHRDRISDDWLDWLDFEPHQNTMEETDKFVEYMSKVKPEHCHGKKKEELRERLIEHSRELPKDGYAPIPRSFSEKERVDFKNIPKEILEKTIENILKARNYVSKEDLLNAFNKIAIGAKTPFEALAPILYISLRRGGKSASID